MDVAPTALHMHGKRRRAVGIGAMPAAPTASRVATATGVAWSALTAPMPDVGPVSRAEGEFPVNEAKARADAALALSRIDFSKRNIMIWVPGTEFHTIDSYFQKARDFERQPGDDLSLSVMDYTSTWDLRHSCPTGIATLKLVLEGIRQRLGADLPNHVVTLGGHSQGAWVIGEALADPTYANFVKRAVLFGHPWLAAHQYNSGQDPRVRVINHFDDQVTLPISGSAADGLDTMANLRQGHLSGNVGLLVRTVVHNPHHGWLLLKGYTYDWPVFKGIWHDAHNYEDDMLRGYVYLQTGNYVPQVTSDRQVYGSLDS
jgi:hypothetical protein